MPRTAVTAIVLCILAQGAFAECITAATTKSHPAAVSEPVRAGAATTKAKPGTRASGELIKTAAAGTRDDAPPAVQATHGQDAQDGQDHPRRGGTAMLLAALALMSGIALRRYGAHDA